jgi:hypothetical protein
VYRKERSYCYPENAFFICRHIQKTAKGDSFIMSAQMSVHSSACNNLAPNGQILMKYHILIFFKNLLRKFKSD